MAFQVIANAALQVMCPPLENVTKAQVFPEGHIAPGTLIANTDTKHYQHLVEKIYRQQSWNLSSEIDKSQVHTGLYHKE